MNKLWWDALKYDDDYEWLHLIYNGFSLGAIIINYIQIIIIIYTNV